MSNHVCNNALLKCSMGAVPSPMGVLPDKQVMTFNQPAANINDHLPFTNIRMFGPCNSPLNPATAAATAAALGVLTPAPCLPNTPAPWIPGQTTVMLKNLPALNKESKLMCIAGGVITVMFEGQATHQIP